MPMPTRSSDWNRSSASSGVMRMVSLGFRAGGVPRASFRTKGRRGGKFDGPRRGNQAGLSAARKIVFQRGDVFRSQIEIDALAQVALQRIRRQLEFQRGSFGDV